MRELSLWKRAVLFALGLVCVADAYAHDFWIQPRAFSLEPSAVMHLTMMVGHAHEPERSQIASRRVTRFVVVSPTGEEIDLREQLHARGAAEDVSLRLDVAGTYVVMIETDAAARSVLAADRFNAYLESEGLTPALEQRVRDGRINMPGTEQYSRRAKALVQVGPPDGRAQSAVTQPLGARLEIVPMENPYASPRPTALPVRVVFEGQPLAGALVAMSQLHHGGEPSQTLLTDANGRASFIMPMSGDWLLTVAWTKPLPKSADVDFETVFSSLTFTALGDQP